MNLTLAQLQLLGVTLRCKPSAALSFRQAVAVVAAVVGNRKLLGGGR